jgi:putative inorganic carbon (hco3(-)) transporter
MKGLLFTYAMTYGGAFVSLVNPFYGLLVYICFAIIRPEAMWFWSVPKGNYSRVVAIGLLVGWIIHGFGDWRFGRARAVVLSLIVFWGWTLVVAMSAQNQTSAQYYAETLTKIVLPFLVGATLIDSVQKLLQLAWCITLSEAYVAVEMNQSYFAGVNRAWRAGFGSLDNNGLALTMVCGAALALFLGLETRKWYGKLAAFGGSLLMIHTVLFTFSRGGMLGLVISALVGFWLIPKRPQHYLVFGLAVALGFALAGKEVTERFMTIFKSEEERDASAESRIDLAKSCLDIMYQKPWGIGPLQYVEVSHQFGFTKGKAAHTTWLQIGAEQGVIGLAAIAGFYLLCLSRLWPLARESLPSDPALCSLSRVVIAAIPGFIVSAQFISLSLVEIPYYTILIGVGVLRLSSVRATDAILDSFDEFPIDDPLLPADMLEHTTCA